MRDVDGGTKSGVREEKSDLEGLAWRGEDLPPHGYWSKPPVPLSDAIQMRVLYNLYDGFTMRTLG